MRADGRNPDALREVRITRDFIKPAEGSVLIEVGETRVICTASIEEKVPPFLKDQQRGWVTAEYSMLPRATQTRSSREAAVGRVGGRTYEIQRLIGRSLRAVVDMSALGERTVWVDCDVIQADGGTRTAAITGGFMAMADALRYALDCGMVSRMPILDCVAAVSVGVVEGEPLLDLNYGEDFAAEVDMNIVMTGTGKFVEVQGTAESQPFDSSVLDAMLKLAKSGIEQLIAIQKEQVLDIC